jgi:hypothetical protein
MLIWDVVGIRVGYGAGWIPPTTEGRKMKWGMGIPHPSPTKSSTPPTATAGLAPYSTRKR